MRRKKTDPASNEAFAAFHRAFPHCWMCHFLDQRQRLVTQLHHIAGRGRQHDVWENFAALCSDCHTAIQSRKDAELVCLVLKLTYDYDWYSPALICHLRGRAESCWTRDDVKRAATVMKLMRECYRG